MNPFFFLLHILFYLYPRLLSHLRSIFLHNRGRYLFAFYSLKDADFDKPISFFPLDGHASLNVDLNTNTLNISRKGRLLVLQAAHGSDLSDWAFHLFSVLKAEEGEKKKEKKKERVMSSSKKGKENEEKEKGEVEGEKNNEKGGEKGVDKVVEKVEKQDKGSEKGPEKGSEKGFEKGGGEKGADGGHKWDWMKPKMPVFCYVCKKLAFRQEGYECLNCGTWVHSGCGAQVVTPCDVLQKRYKKHGTFQRVFILFYLIYIFLLFFFITSIFFSFFFSLPSYFPSSLFQKPGTKTGPRRKPRRHGHSPPIHPPRTLLNPPSPLPLPLSLPHFFFPLSLPNRPCL